MIVLKGQKNFGHIKLVQSHVWSFNLWSMRLGSVILH